MSDFLSRLAERQLAAVPAVAPRALSRFAPAPSSVPETPVVSTRPPVPVVDDERAATTQRVVFRVDTERVIESVVTAHEDSASRADVAVTTHQHQPPLPPRVSTGEIDRLPADRAAVAHVTSEPALLVPSSPERDVTTLDERQTSRDEIAAERPRRALSPAPPMTPTAPALLVPRPPPVTNALPPLMHSMEPHPVASAEPPPVKVTIGRIEVRAVTPPPRRERTTVDRHKALSLEDYLDRRRGGRR